MKSLRRIALSAATILLVTAGTVALGQSAAFAACTPTFDYAYGDGYSHIFVHCGGNEVAKIYVGNPGTGTYSIYINDEECDSIGPYWHAWQTGGKVQYDYGAGGCGGTPTYHLTAAQIITSKDWWVEWGGHNSRAVAFPYA